jgi:hypothetical protein
MSKLITVKEYRQAEQNYLLSLIEKSEGRLHKEIKNNLKPSKEVNKIVKTINNAKNIYKVENTYSSICNEKGVILFTDYSFTDILESGGYLGVSNRFWNEVHMNGYRHKNNGL